MADATWDTLKNGVLRSGESEDSVNNWTLRDAHAAATRLYLDTIPKIDLQIPKIEVQKPVQPLPENTPANNIAGTVSNIINEGGIPLLRNEGRSAEFGLSFTNTKSNNFDGHDSRFTGSEPLRFPGKTEPKDYTPGVYVKFKF